MRSRVKVGIAKRENPRASSPRVGGRQFHLYHAKHNRASLASERKRAKKAICVRCNASLRCLEGVCGD